MTEKPTVSAGKVHKSYTEEFRRYVVRMIESEGLTTAEVGRRLGVNANLLRKWREKCGKKSEAQSIQSDLEAENRRLRDENRRLLMEREILRKATVRRNGGLTALSGPLRRKKTEISVHSGSS